MKRLIYSLTFLFVVCSIGCATENAVQSSSKSAASASKVAEQPKTIEPKRGDLATRGGKATVRKSYTPQTDDPITSDDESNNQPLGHMGTVTLRVHNVSSGHSYPVDADVEKTEDGYELHRLYFVKGGWVDFISCDLDENYEGYCSDENGRDWDIQGEQ